MIGHWLVFKISKIAYTHDHLVVTLFELKTKRLTRETLSPSIDPTLLPYLETKRQLYFVARFNINKLFLH